MTVVLEMRGAGGFRKWLLAGTVAEDWAEMRVLQWFRGVRPPRSSQKFDTPLRRARGYAIIHAVF